MGQVTFFTHSLGIGGAQRVLVNVSGELSERGHDVEIILRVKRGQLLEEVHEDVSVKGLNADPFLPMVQALRKYINRNQPEVLVSTLNTANLAAILAIKSTRTSTRHIVRMANTPSWKAKEYDELLTDRAFPFLMKLLFPLHGRYITISQGQADDLIENYNVKRENITVIYNPCITDELYEKAREDIHHDWLTSSDYKSILSVGSLTEQKDHSTLIQAFAGVLKHQDSYRLLVVGEGPKREQLQELARNLGVEDSLELLGETPNPYPYMVNADVFVLSSRWEGFGIVLVEAMALGTPVISTDCPHGPREILDNGTFGTLVPVGQSEPLTDAIIEVAENHSDEQKLEKRAMEFHTNKITNKYEEVLFG